MHYCPVFCIQNWVYADKGIKECFLPISWYPDLSMSPTLCHQSLVFQHQESFTSPFSWFLQKWELLLKISSSGQLLAGLEMWYSHSSSHRNKKEKQLVVFRPHRNMGKTQMDCFLALPAKEAKKVVNTGSRCSNRLWFSTGWMASQVAMGTSVVWEGSGRQWAPITWIPFLWSWRSGFFTPLVLGAEPFL